MTGFPHFGQINFYDPGSFLYKCINYLLFECDIQIPILPGSMGTWLQILVNLLRRNTKLPMLSMLALKDFTVAQKVTSSEARPDDHWSNVWPSEVCY